jgi:hypothetical protein
MKTPRSQAIHCGLRLDPGEQTLWQGAPSWTSLATSVFHVRLIGGYFLVFVGLGAIGVLSGRAPLAAMIVPAVVGMLVASLICGFAWGVARSTTYLVTTRRVILRYGVALPRSLSLPFRQIAAMSVALQRGQRGDIALTLRTENHIPYLKLWPHAKPWNVRTPKPMLRGIPKAGVVAAILSRELSQAEYDRIQVNNLSEAIAA